MKHFLTFLLLLLGLWLPAQSYYVALVKGKVYYDDVLLKPRTKIELRGNFRFTSKDDYVKVSGPNGIHTIRPVPKESGGYEFLRAVTQELFPEAKPRGSFVLSTWVFPGDVLSVYAENEYQPDVFVEGEKIPLKGHLKKWQYKKLYWVSQVYGGSLLREPATVEDDMLVLNYAPFAEAASRDSVLSDQVFLFYIDDWLTFRGYADQFGLEALFWATNPDAQPGGSYAPMIASSLGGDPTEQLVAESGKLYQPYPDIIGFSSIPVHGVLPSDPLMKDMLEFQLSSGETSVETFLLGSRMTFGEDYSSILLEKYGQMNIHRVKRAYVDYLYTHRKDDPRTKELWKLNRN